MADVKPDHGKDTKGDTGPGNKMADVKPDHDKDTKGDTGPGNRPPSQSLPAPVKVKTTVPPIRTLFEGPVEAAKKYVENNFPRVHVNPQNPADEPQPDVSVSGEGIDGELSYWGPEEGWEKAE